MSDVVIPQQEWQRDLTQSEERIKKMVAEYAEEVGGKSAKGLEDVQSAFDRFKEERVNAEKQFLEGLEKKQREDRAAMAVKLEGKALQDPSWLVKHTGGPKNDQVMENPALAGKYDLQYALSCGGDDQFKGLRDAHDAAALAFHLYELEPQKDNRRRSAEAAHARFCREAGILGYRADDFPLNDPRKGLDTTDASPWHYTGMSGEARLFFDLAEPIVGAFESMPHPANTRSWDMPVATSTPTFHKWSELTADVTATTVPATASQPGVYKATFTPVVGIARIGYSREIDEHAAFAIAPVINALAQRGATQATASCMINGDVSTTHQDSTLNKNFDSAWEGFRFLGLNDTTTYDNGGFAFDATAIRSGAKRGGKWMMNPRECVMIPSINAYFQMIGFTDTRTVQNYGGQATILTGELGNIYGYPILTTGQWPNLNSSGVVDATAANNTKTGMVLVHRGVFMRDIHRGVGLETQYYPRFQATDLVFTFAADFKPLENPAGTGNDFVVYWYDITLA